MDPREFQTSYEVEGAHWWYRGQRYLMARFFRQHFIEDSELRILDVGCGTGINLSSLEQFGLVYGMDISKEATSYCRKRGHKIIQGSVVRMPFADNSFDVVTSLGVFYHRHVDNDLRGMSEIFRVLKPNGRLFFFDSAMNCLSGNHDIVFHGIRRYMKSELMSKLNKAGFLVDWLSYANASFFPIVYVKRRIERMFHLEQQSEVIMVNRLSNFLLFSVCIVDAICASIMKYPVGLNIVAHARKISFAVKGPDHGN